MAYYVCFSLGLRDVDLSVELGATALAGLCPPTTTEICPPTVYRSFSGHCNNVQNPLWGAALEPLQRLASNAYTDGLSAPRSGKGGSELPNVRRISLELFTNHAERHSSVTEITAYWFYFVASDLVNVAPNQCIINGWFAQVKLLI